MIMINQYGVSETNPLPEGYHNIDREAIEFDELQASDHIQLDRLRLVTDSGFPMYDISYVHLNVNGKPVDVTFSFPVSQLNKRTYKKELYDICKKQGIFIKGLFDNISILR